MTVCLTDPLVNLQMKEFKEGKGQETIPGVQKVIQGALSVILEHF